MDRYRINTGRTVGCLALAVLVLIGAVLGGTALLRGRDVVAPAPQSRCVALVDDLAVTLRPEQARYTAIITGVSVRRGLAPRAASIAMATAYQESDIRNLDYGDRDSVGLFQQRPSQGWGTVEQIMDPYYSTNAFYDALVKVDGWQSGDINDVAQEVQRSGFPDAYRDHEADARVLASVFTGQSPAALRCLTSEMDGPDPDALVETLEDTLGPLTVSEEPPTTPDAPPGLRIATDSEDLAWVVAAQVMATLGEHGVTGVSVGDQRWTHDESALASWQSVDGGPGDEVVITFAT